MTALDDLYARVRGAPAGDVNRAVTDDDVRALAALPRADREDALVALKGLGVAKGALIDRIRSLQKRSLRVVGAEEREDWRVTLRTGDNGPLPVVDNLEIILRNKFDGRLSYDAMALRPCLDDKGMTDEDITAIRCEIGQTEGVTFQVGDTRSALVLVSRRMREFHPVQDYLRALVWDGVPRLWTMARDHLLLEDVYSNTVLARTMIAAVARGLVREHSPTLGMMVKTVTIILGEQDAKKSTLWRVIGSPWFGDSKVDIEDRKGKITLASKWFYEFPEIDGMLSRHSNESTKAFTGQWTDDYLLPYGSTNITVPRSWLMVGTTNKDKFLTDPTGSSRWHILDIRPNGGEWTIDEVKLLVARDQLFAEAVREWDAYLALQKQGVPNDQNPHRIFLNREENRERASRNEAYQVEDLWAPTVSAWLVGAPITCPACKGSGGHGGNCTGCGGRGRVERGALLRDDSDREYVTVDQVLTQAIGVPLERLPSVRNSMISTLAECGWAPIPGRRISPILPGGKRGGKVTPYYQSNPPEPTFAELEARRAQLVRDLAQADDDVEARARADEPTMLSEDDHASDQPTTHPPPAL